MRPEHEARRKIIREWMLLPKEKRRTKEHAEAFAKKSWTGCLVMGTNHSVRILKTRAPCRLRLPAWKEW